jgi:adenylate cyclase class 2
MSQPGNVETEIKLSVASIPEILERLARCGFAISRPEVFEQNDVLDTPGTTLRDRNSLLRIRRAGPDCVITFKGPPVAGLHKVREEVEYTASDPENVRLVFSRLGFERTFRYEKYRTEFRAPGLPGVVTLDRTPIGNYLEIEADSATVDLVAKRLGFEENDYITASYGTLFREYCTASNTGTRDMVFDMQGRSL